MSLGPVESLTGRRMLRLIKIPKNPMPPQCHTTFEQKVPTSFRTPSVRFERRGHDRSIVSREEICVSFIPPAAFAFVKCISKTNGLCLAGLLLMNE